MEDRVGTRQNARKPIGGTGGIDFSLDPCALWCRAADAGNGWKYLPWFGFFNVNVAPWIYHAQHGWMYPLVLQLAQKFFSESTRLRSTPAMISLMTFWRGVAPRAFLSCLRYRFRRFEFRLTGRAAGLSCERILHVSDQCVVPGFARTGARDEAGFDQRPEQIQSPLFRYPQSVPDFPRCHALAIRQELQ